MNAQSHKYIINKHEEKRVWILIASQKVSPRTRFLSPSYLSELFLKFYLNTLFISKASK